MDRAAQFIHLYNRLSDHLRQTTDADKRASFAEMVNRAAQKDAAVRAVENQLKEYADLRNAIVHHRDYPATIIAEPSEAALLEFTAIVEKALAPRRLLPTFRRSVQVFSTGERLVEALKYMRDHDYSQVVVRDSDGLALLTVEGVARWLEQQADAESIGIAEATVGDAFAHEVPDTFTLMSGERTLFEAQEAFAAILGRRQPRLFAILITQNGRPDEPLHGIVTPWDLLRNDDA